MQQLYPLFVDLSDLRVLIVGAGAVAVRKARGVLDGGAKHVTIVAPAFADDLPEGVVRVGREFADADLDDIDLCFAATDRQEVNSRIVGLCRRRRILVNRADRDDQRPGTFTVPAMHRTGAVTVAVSASGSPKLAAAIRDEIAQFLDEGWAMLAEVALEMRQSIVGMADVAQPQRAVMLRELASREALQVLRENGRDGVRRWMLTRFPELRRVL